MIKQKDSQVKISVIVATFNHEEFLGRCLRSLLSQSIAQEDYEIVVVDDGSSDRTAFALTLFSDPHDSQIKVVRNETNLGLPASLNRGIDASSGELIVRVDSDDFVNTHFLLFLSSFLEMNPDINAVACDYLLLNDQEQVLARRDCEVAPIACGIMFRKKMLEELGCYDENFLVNEEKDLRIRMENVGEAVAALHVPLYRYRRHQNNMTNDHAKLADFDHKLYSKHS